LIKGKLRELKAVNKRRPTWSRVTPRRLDGPAGALAVPSYAVGTWTVKTKAVLENSQLMALGEEVGSIFGGGGEFFWTNQL